MAAQIQTALTILQRKQVEAHAKLLHSSMIFIELPIFTRTAADLFDDDALQRLQARLVAKPDTGKLVPGSGGLRKLRVALPGRGRRGGGRVIYYWQMTHDRIYLVFAYAKNAQGDLTPDQLRQLAALARAEIGE